MERRTSSVADQVSAAVVDKINTARVAEEATQLFAQDAAFQKAMDELTKVRDFVNDPEHILGSDGAKHGEVAEQVEVGVRRAWAWLRGAEQTATFDGVDRFAAEDYLIDGLGVQSKFINGVNNTLTHVLNHMSKYENFGRDGTFYHIPKDQFQLIQDVLNGETHGLNAKTIRAILDKVAQVERDTGQPFNEVVQPGVSSYAEVQLGKVHETLDGHQNELHEENENLKEQISLKHEPSWAEGLKAAGTAAAVGAALGFASKAWAKYREGKNIFKGDFTAQDWKDVGGSALQSGVAGGLAGGAIYALTNCAGMAAPFAGAFVTAAKGVASLAADYHAGKLSLEALIDNGLFVCSDAAIVGLCTFAGQTLIPLPVVGGILGALAGKFLSTFLNKKLKQAQVVLDDKLQQFRAALGAEFQAVIARMEAKFSELGDLTVAAFDHSSNQDLVEASVALARAHGVSEALLIQNDEDLDAFMKGA